MNLGPRTCSRLNLGKKPSNGRKTKLGQYPAIAGKSPCYSRELRWVKYFHVIAGNCEHKTPNFTLYLSWYEYKLYNIGNITGRGALVLDYIKFIYSILSVIYVLINRNYFSPNGIPLGNSVKENILQIMKYKGKKI